jgi:3-hydroxyanthranilate 3,4-dioxygenase
MAATMTATSVLPPINIMKWVKEHRHELKPPVGNKYLYDGRDYFVMVIAGPNARNDFHIVDSEEYFYQLKGDIVVRIWEDGHIIDVPIREGETFFIPPNVPHAPTRPPDTIGIVVERVRPPGETEHQVFYCDNCHALVHDNEFDCADIVDHFARAMEDFWADPKLSTCKQCGTRVPKPKPVKRIVFEPKIVIEREK